MSIKNVAIILISALSFYFSTGFHTVWILLWLAPFPVLIIALQSTGKVTAMMAFSSFLLGSLNWLTYLISLSPVLLAVGFLLLQAFFFAISVIIARYIVLKTRHWISIFAFPAVWTSYEFISATFSPHSTFGNLAYTQIDVLPLIQIASVTGLWGITFLVFLLPSTCAFIGHFINKERRTFRALVITTVLLAATLIFGTVRLSSHTVDAATIPVGLAVSDSTVRLVDSREEKIAKSIMKIYSPLIQKLAQKGAKVIVLPEKFVGVTPEYSTPLSNELATISSTKKVIIVAGFNQLLSSGKRNTAVVFGKDGQKLMEYDKIHFVPGWEDGYIQGNKKGLFQIDNKKVGVAICKDMDFPPLGRGYAQSNIGIMFVPAWDFFQDARYHCRMAVMRGIEGGYSIVRTAQEGLTTISDDRGRILSEKSSSSAAKVILLGEAPFGSGSTFYSQMGDWFPLLVIFLLIGLISWSVRRTDSK